MLRFMAQAIVVITLFAVALARSARSLEVESVQGTSELGAWRASSSQTVAYYNVCTGWYWTWTLNRGDRFGAVFDRPVGQTVLAGTDLLQYRWATCGYPYSAAVEIFALDEQGCPVGAPLASQPYVAQWDDANWGIWVAYDWNVPVPPRFAFMMTFADWSYGGEDCVPSTPRVVTDHPSAGPSGPQACGFCYPETREPHSFWFGDVSQWECPPWVMVDPFLETCVAELVCRARFESPVSASSASWGRIKSLYR